MSTSTDATMMLDAALDYAERGWPVIPLHTPRPGGGCTCSNGLACQSPGKHPRITNWQTQATTDPAKIREWWTKWPDANIGIAWGERAGIIDIEADNAEQDRLVVDLFDGNLPICPSFKAARFPHRLFRWRVDLPGGAVIYYRDLGIRIGNSDKGVMSVVPPSLHASGKRYEWLPGLGPDDVSPPELPNQVSVKLWNLSGQTNPRANGKPKSIRHALYEQPSVPEGSRNDVLYAEACALWNEQAALHGATACNDPDVVAVVLTRLRGANLLKCRPPLDDSEVGSVCESGRKFIARQAAQEEEPQLPMVQSAGEKDEAQAKAETKTESAPDKRRERFLRKIRLALTPKFVGAVQYGREDSSYDLVFECAGVRETIKLESTTELLSKARVQVRLVEKLRGAIKVSQKQWPGVARMILRIAEVRPGIADEEAVLDRLRDYLRQEIARRQEDGKGRITPLDPKRVVSRGVDLPDDDYAGRTQLRDVKSFVGTDGALYLKLAAFQSWLAREWTRIPDKKLTAALARLGFVSGIEGKVSHTVNGQDYEGRYWVLPDWDRIIGSAVMGNQEV